MAAHNEEMCIETEEVNLILDPETSTFIGNAPLYHSADDPNTFFLDEAMTVKVQLYTTVTKQEDILYTVDTAPLPQHESFTTEQSLFLIDLMRQQLEVEGECLLNALKELNPQVKSGRIRKKHMWREMATRLSRHFQQVFRADRVARQWYALEEEYTKAKEYDKEHVTFQLFNEMEELLDGHRDIEFPVVGTVKGVEVRRTKMLNAVSGRNSPATAHTGSATLAATPTASATPSLSTPTGDPAGRRTDEQYWRLLDFLKESIFARQRRHEETLAQMKSDQDGFEALMNRFLDKM